MIEVEVACKDNTVLAHFNKLDDFDHVDDTHKYRYDQLSLAAERRMFKNLYLYKK